MFSAFAGLCSFIRSGDTPLWNWLVRNPYLQSWEKGHPPTSKCWCKLSYLLVDLSYTHVQCCANTQNEALSKAYQVDIEFLKFKWHEISILMILRPRLCPVRCSNQLVHYAVFKWMSFLQKWSQKTAPPLQSQIMARIYGSYAIQLLRRGWIRDFQANP